MVLKSSVVPSFFAEDEDLRCGVYVQDEEYDAAMVAADAQTWRDIEGFTYSQIRNMWEAGYRHGYTLGASGESLEKELQIG